MSDSRWVMLPLLLPMALDAACTPESERAANACRAEVRTRLVRPSTAAFRDVRVARQPGGDAGDWRVDLIVTAANLADETMTSSVSCTLGREFALLDLTGEDR